MSWRRSAADRERDEEIAAHLAEAVDFYKAQGMSEADAIRKARLRFGNPRAYREQVDDMNRLPIFDALASDLRYGLRRLRKAPGFNAIIIVTLALAIGATGAVFSLADAILLRPLPLPNPGRLAVVSFSRVSTAGEFTGPAVDGAMWTAVRDRVKLVDAAISVQGSPSVSFVFAGNPSFVRTQQVGDGYFRVLGVTPLIGREFTLEEARAGGPPVAILSFGFWQRVFQGRTDAIGQAILLRGEPYTVVGVMPEGFEGLVESAVWIPLTSVGQGLNYMAVARLRDGVTVEQANAELAALGAEPFTMLRANSSSQRKLVLARLQDTLSAGARPSLVMLGWAVGAVLLIACVNIAALLMARSSSRFKEVATRIALGGSRAVVVRQLMVESLIVAVIGGAAGVLVAYAGLEGLKTIGKTTFSAWGQATLDARAVAVSLGLSSLTSLVFGLLPAWQTSRIDVQSALLSSGSRSVVGGSSHLMRRLLVAAEVALGVVMLVGGGLLLRQFLFLQSLDPGFTSDRLYTVSTSLQDARYRESAAITQLFTSSVERLRGTPGIEAAAVSQGLPYQRLLNMGFRIDGQAESDTQPPIANFVYVTPGFFETFRIAMAEGRPIADRDRAGMPAVVVVNETFRQIYFKGEPALGRRLRHSNSTMEIVGVSRDVQQFAGGFSLPQMRRGPLVASPTIYLPAAQAERGLLGAFSPFWTVRARSAAEASSALATAIQSADPLLPLGPVRAMDEVMGESVAQPRLLLLLVGTLAIAAVLLAAIGVHGLIAQVVAERTREFGVRMALGAPAGRIVRTVAQSGVGLAALGALVGMGLSFPATSLVAASVPNMSTRDPATYFGVALVLVIVATVSSLLPSLRIARLDPVKILRE